MCYASLLCFLHTIFYFIFFFQAEDGIRDSSRQESDGVPAAAWVLGLVASVSSFVGQAFLPVFPSMDHNKFSQTASANAGHKRTPVLLMPRGISCIFSPTRNDKHRCAPL